MAFLPEEFLPDAGTESRKAMEADMEPGVIQDRRQEIVIIGSDLNKEAITKALDDCLLREDENENRMTAKMDRDPEDVKKNGWKFGWKENDGEENPMPVWPDHEEMLEQLIQGAEDEEEEDGDDDDEDDEGEAPEKKNKN